MTLTTFTVLSTLAVIFVTFFGPILAVQTQKWIERNHEKRAKKFRVFEILMATRASRMHVDHVRGLNMIEVAFYGKGPGKRGLGEQEVLNRWARYLDHLNNPAEADSGWAARGDALFGELLGAMATELGFASDPVQHRKGYTPKGHYNHEQDLLAVAANARKVLSGEQRLKMDVMSFPIDPAVGQAQILMAQKAAAALDVQKDVAEKILESYSGGEGIPVSVKNIPESDAQRLPKNA